jgi:hypothetical protein
VARKLRGFERVLDAPALFAIAYGEIASSLYIALGIVAAQALGLTPLVLLLTGALFFVVSLSYAEGTAALPETGGAATFVRRAFNDLAGFITGWALFLDFLIVIALSSLFVPHYLGAAISSPSLRESPWDAVISCALIAAIAAVRLARRTRVHLGSIAIALLDLLVQSLLVVLGAAFLHSPEVLAEGLGFTSGQEWTDLAYALPLAMGYTGLETARTLRRDASRTLLAPLLPRLRRRRHGHNRCDRPLAIRRLAVDRVRTNGSKLRSSGSSLRSTAMPGARRYCPVRISGALILAGRNDLDPGITRLTYHCWARLSATRFARLGAGRSSRARRSDCRGV